MQRLSATHLETTSHQRTTQLLWKEFLAFCSISKEEQRLLPQESLSTHKVTNSAA